MGGGSGGGGGSGYSTGFPVLWNWSSLMTPWQKAGQQELLPSLMERYKGGGFTPQEEATLWGQAKQQIETGGNMAGKNYARQIASSGISPTSPAVAGGWGDLALGKIRDTASAAMDFIKTKIGARDTATNQLLTALYTNPPVATGQYSTQISNQKTGGGGK